MAEYILSVYRDDATQDRAFAYKLTGIGTIESAYSVLARYQSNHCPEGFRAEIIKVESDYPYWGQFFTPGIVTPS
jgi:hypothetical protein